MRPAFAAASPLIRAARVTRACRPTAPSAVLRRPPAARREASSKLPAPPATRAAGESAPEVVSAPEKPAEVSAGRTTDQPPVEASAARAIDEPSAAAVATGRARVEERGEAGKVRLLWDSECPLCVREIEGLRAHAASKFDVSPVVFVDVADLEYDAAENGGVGYERAMGKIHAVDADGVVVDGVEVFRKTYEALGLRWIYAPTRLPGVGWAVERAYDVWAVNRLRLTGRPGLQELVEARSKALETLQRGEGTCR